MFTPDERGSALPDRPGRGPVVQPGGGPGRRRRRRAAHFDFPARRPPARPTVEELENLTLLSASILGTVWNDQGGTGVRPASAPGVPGETVYLDLGKNHQSSRPVTVAAASTAIVPATGQLAGLVGAAGVASLQLRDLTAIRDLSVGMDLVNNGPAPVTVGVISPTGLTVPNFPTLFSILPGEHFVGSFSQAASTPVSLAARPLAPGGYVPVQFFSDPPAHIYDGSPDGTWGLVFVGDTSKLVLNGWSLSFKAPDPTATTDANGNYAFTGLAPGTYQVATLLPPGESQTGPAGGGPRSVTVADGQTAGGVNFGVRPASAVSTRSFYLSAPASGWGQSVTVNYTLENQGNGAAPAFDVAVVLSPDGVVRGGAGTTLQTLHFGGLAAHSSATGSATVTLPASPPAGFGAAAQTYIGFSVDPKHALARNDASVGADQGMGVDKAALAVAPNRPVVSGAGVQQMPSVAVEPNHPDHVVVAYMDYSLLKTGYAGIGVSVSDDGGATWARTSVPLPAGFDQGAASPVVHFDGQGNVFVSFSSATFLGASRPGLTNPSSSQRALGFASNNGIFVSRSADGGASWGPPVAVASHAFAGTPGTAGTTGPAGTQVPFDIEPAFDVDTHKTLPGGAPNPNFNSLYVTWVRAYPPGQFPGNAKSTAGSDVMVAASRDGGLTWTTQAQDRNGLRVSAIKDPKYGDNGTGLAGRGFVFYPQISVGPAGDLYVSTFAGGFFSVYHSFDGGASFRAPDYDNQLGVPFGAPVLPFPTPFADNFRTLSVRDIVADPTRPGRVYVLEANQVNNSAVGGVVDSGEIVFAYSNDYGQTWEDQFQVGKEATNLSSLPPGQDDGFLSALNDDDGGRSTQFDTGPQLNQEVISAQAMPSLSVDAQGRLTVIWYDSRRDPSQQALDVFGTVSGDGGKTWAPNFRVSDTSFDPNQGAFKDATGKTDFYLGDRIGVAAADGTAYAVWTDTRNGGQDVELQKYSLTQPPQAPLGRFYPDNTPASATGLGPVTVQQVVPSLAVSPANDNWFNLQAGASGQLDVLATVTSGDASALRVSLTDANGNPLPAPATPVLNASGAVAGVELVYPSVAGATYLVHVSGGKAAVGYSLVLGALTADLGTGVQGGPVDTLAAGGQNLYRLKAAVGGSLVLTLTPGQGASGGLALQALSADGQTVLAAGPAAGTAAGVVQTVTLPVTQGEVVLLSVSGADPNAAGGFALTYANLDQYETTGIRSLFFPTSSTPSSVAVAALSGGSRPDIIVSSTDTADPVNVLLGNADGTFQAPHQYDVGPGLSGLLTAGYRQVGVADFNGDSLPDVVVPNFRAGDVSVLLGNGGGGFKPQRRFDAVASPDSLVTGRFHGPGKPVDIAALQNFPQLGGVSELAVMAGRGDGTFRPAQTYPTVFTNGAGPMVVGDFNGDGVDDLIVFSKNDPLGEIFVGNGDGTFRPGLVFPTAENVFAAEAMDLNGGGRLSLVTTGTNSGNVYVMPGNGDGTFGTPSAFTAMTPRPGDNVGVYGLAVVGFDSTASGSERPAPGAAAVKGQPGVYVTAQSRSGFGPAEVVFLPAQFDAGHRFAGFGTPQVEANLKSAGKIAAFNGNGLTNLAAADTGGVLVVYGLPASAPGATVTVPQNDTPATARDLGNGPHLVTLPRAIVAGHEDAYYTYTVPTEQDAASGPEVVDFSALFEYTGGAGLLMQVTDAGGRVLGSGDRFQVVAAEGAVLTVHVSGRSGGAAGAQGGSLARGTGSYTLDIDVLPQVVSVEALAVAAGDPVTTLVVTFQGDRLDPATAEDPANYTVTWHGPGGDQVIPVSSRDGGQPVVYNPGANLDVTSGLSYPTAVHQTAALVFASPLPAGSYSVRLSPRIQAALYHSGESALLAAGGPVTGHPLVSVSGGSASAGAAFEAPGLVPTPGSAAHQDSIASGSAFLTQLQSDLAALLDARLRNLGDAPGITADLNKEILARFAGLFTPQVGFRDPSAPQPSVTVLWLDPVSINLQSTQGLDLNYSLSSNQVANGLGGTFVSVGGNVELIVMENAAGTFNMGVSNVPAAARGGEVELTSSGISSQEFTAAMRGGQQSFQLNLGETAGAAVGPPAPDNPGNGGSVASAGGFSSLAAASLVGTLVLGAPGSSPGGSAGNAETEAAAAQATAVAVNQGAATVAVTQSTSGGVGQKVNGEDEDEVPPIANPEGLPITELVKTMMAKFKGAVDALRKAQWSSVLREWQSLLNGLIRGEARGAEGGEGARLDGARGENSTMLPKAPAADPGPANAPTDTGRADGILWDQGLDGLLRDRERRLDPERPPVASDESPATAGPGAFWAAAFLAAGLSHAGFRDPPRFGSRPPRKPRPWAPEPGRTKV